MANKEKHVTTSIDKINLNSRHYAKFPKDEAVKRILADHKESKLNFINEAWAGKAYDQMVIDVQKTDQPKEPVANAENPGVDAKEKIDLGAAENITMGKAVGGEVKSKTAGK